MFVEAIPKTSESNFIFRPVKDGNHSHDQTFAERRPYKILHNVVEGRIRFIVPRLRYNEELKDIFEKHFLQRKGVENVSISSITGTLLLTFDPKILARDLILQAIEILLSSTPKVMPRTRIKEDSPSKIIRPLSFEVSKSTDAEVDWHKKEKDEVLTQLRVRFQSGLSDLSFAERLKEYGPNRIHAPHVRTPWDILKGQIVNLPIMLLIGSAGISFATAATVEGAVILALIGTNAIIGYRTEMAAERTASLIESTPLSTISVRRNRSLIQVVPEQLVPGDLIWVKEGMMVPVDARLLETHGLTVDESALTGESLPIVKTVHALQSGICALADRTNMIYRGTLITGGSAIAVVVATGTRTELGKIQGLVNKTRNSQTPLQRQTHELTNILIYGSLGLGISMLGIGALYSMGVIPTLQLSLAMTVAAIPEGLPVLVTITLAQSANKMRRKNVLVRNLDAIETLGAAQILCLDKTGTLTQNRMSVVSLYAGMRELDWTGALESIVETLHTPIFADVLRLLHVAVLCNDTEILQDSDAKPKLNGSPTEAALVEMALNANLDVEDLRIRFPLLKTDYRTENKSYMQTEHTLSENKRFLAVKGSPAQVLELCTKQMKGNKVVALSKIARNKIIAQNERMGSSALRVLGLAYAEVEDGEAHDLIWLGLVGMKDIERKGAKELIRALHEAGIKPVMITGDQSGTAGALAHSLGFAPDGNLQIVDFTEIKDLSDEELEKHALGAHVFSRVAPSEKLRIVQMLKAQSKIVAMVGDGINDTPALKASHIGVAMGKRGADVAREVANVVIMDDNVRTLLPAIERGRTSHESIRKAIHFLLSTNFSETLLMLSAGALGMGQALHPLQILWINLLSDLFPALALAMEPSDPRVLKRGPQNPHAPLMNRKDFKRIGAEASVMAGLALLGFGVGTAWYGRGARAQTMAFVTLTSAQLLHTFSSRSAEHSIFGKGTLPKNKNIALAVLSGFALQCIPLAVPSVRRMFALAPLGVKDLLVCGGLALSNFVLNEAYRGLKGEKNNEA